MKSLVLWLADQHDESGKEHSHDCAKIPNFVMAFSSEIMLFFGGADAVQDLMVTKNNLLDKTEV